MNIVMPLDLGTMGVMGAQEPRLQAKQSSAGGPYCSVLVQVNLNTLFPSGLTTEVSLLSVLVTTEHSVTLRLFPQPVDTLLLGLHALLNPGLWRKLWVHSNCLQCCLLLDARSFVFSKENKKAFKALATLADTTAGLNGT